MISLQHISKTFNKGQINEVRALNSMDLSIEKGEFVVLVGANGSGKSTLLNLLAGQILADSGTIKIDGNDVTRLEDFQRSRWIARIFQNPLMGTAPDLSIVENFRLASIRTRSKTLTIGNNRTFEQIVREKVSILNMGLEDKIHQAMGTLSGGQRQALTLLMGVMDDLKLLLMDEPTAALDPKSADIVMKTAQEIIQNAGLTAVLVTHHIKDACTYGNRIIQLQQGSFIRDIQGVEKSMLTEMDIYKWFI